MMQTLIYTLSQTGGSGANSEDAAAIAALVVMAVLGLLAFVVIVGSVVWTFFDARARGKSGCLAALLVFWVAWPIGLIIWLVARPAQKLTDQQAVQPKNPPT